MSKPTTWKDIAELIGIAAIVASLLAVAFELRQSTQELRFATLDSTLGHYNNWRGKVIENTEVAGIWRKGLAGEELTQDEELRFRLLLQELMFAHQAAYVRIKGGADYSEGQAATMRSSIARMLQNEAIRSRWMLDRFGASYNVDFIEFADSTTLD